MSPASQGPVVRAGLKLADRFIPAHLLGQEEAHRRARMVVLSAFGMAALLLTIMLVRELTTGQPVALRIAGLLGAALCVSGALLYRVTGSAWLAGSVTPLTVTSLLATVAHVEGLGLSAPMMFAAPLIPGLAIAFLGLRGMYVFAGLVVLQGAVVVALPLLGFLRPPPDVSPGGVEALQLFGLLLATLLLVFLTSVMERQRRRAELGLKQSEERHRALLEAVPDLMLRVDRKGAVLDMHGGDSRSIWPLSDASTPNRTLADILPADLAARAAKDIAATLEKNQLTLQEFGAQTQEGARIYEMRQMPSGAHEVTVILRDITGRKQEEQALQHRARHDSLTGLVNRREFRDTISAAIERHETQRSAFALLFIDLDRFKPINDVFGHAVGDSVLAQVGQRLSNALRAGDLAARYGGDEFTILLRNVDDVQAPLDVAHRVLGSLTRPMQVEGHMVEVGASIGVALFPLDAKSLDDLLQSADIAMYAAKSAGGDTVQRFNPNLEVPTSHERRL